MIIYPLTFNKFICAWMGDALKVRRFTCDFGSWYYNLLYLRSYSNYSNERHITSLYLFINYQPVLSDLQYSFVAHLCCIHLIQFRVHTAAFDHRFIPTRTIKTLERETSLIKLLNLTLNCCNTMPVVKSAR